MMKREKIPQIIAIIGCISGICASFLFYKYGMAFAVLLHILTLGKEWPIPLYMVIGNTILGIAVSISAAAMAFSKKKKVAAIFIIIFSMLGNILIIGFYLVPSIFFIAAAVLLLEQK